MAISWSSRRSECSDVTWTTAGSLFQLFASVASLVTHSPHPVPHRVFFATSRPLPRPPACRCLIGPLGPPSSALFDPVSFCPCCCRRYPVLVVVHLPSRPTDPTDRPDRPPVPQSAADDNRHAHNGETSLTPSHRPGRFIGQALISLVPASWRQTTQWRGYTALHTAVSVFPALAMFTFLWLLRAGQR